MFSCILLVLFSVFIVSFIQIHSFYSYSWVCEVITQKTAYTGNCPNLKKVLGGQLWQKEGNIVSKNVVLAHGFNFNLGMIISLESQPFFPYQSWLKDFDFPCLKDQIAYVAFSEGCEEVQECWIFRCAISKFARIPFYFSRTASFWNLVIYQVWLGALLIERGRKPA